MRPSPSIFTSRPDDRDVYLVLDDFGERLGCAWRETEEESADRHAVITDLVDGQYRNPVRVIALNTAKGWSRDGSAEIADEIARRCAMDGFDVPPALESFVDRHGSGRPVQLPLPLRRQALQFKSAAPEQPSNLLLAPPTGRILARFSEAALDPASRGHYAPSNECFRRGRASALGVEGSHDPPCHRSSARY
jgi:hypothetical protein